MSIDVVLFGVILHEHLFKASGMVSDQVARLPSVPHEGCRATKRPPAIMGLMRNSLYEAPTHIVTCTVTARLQHGFIAITARFHRDFARFYAARSARPHYFLNRDSSASVRVCVEIAPLFMDRCLSQLFNLATVILYSHYMRELEFSS